MKRLAAFLAFVATFAVCSLSSQRNEWIELFARQRLKGWKTSSCRATGAWSTGAIVGGRPQPSLREIRLLTSTTRSSPRSRTGEFRQYFHRLRAPAPKGYMRPDQQHLPRPAAPAASTTSRRSEACQPDTGFRAGSDREGNHIQIVNGKKVVDPTGEKNTHTKGHFAFQQHGPAVGGPTR